MISTSLGKTLVCPVLIGRTAYLKALAGCIARTNAGNGQILLLGGEAGLGKSRLVAEAQTQITQLGWLTLKGNCFEPDQALPYAPLLDLLRTLINSSAIEQFTSYPGLSNPELLRLLPELTNPLSELPDTQPFPEAGQEKHRLFHTLTQLFIRLATRQPLFIVVEDLHWSDDNTLEFLLCLARHLVSRPIFLLLTYRTNEVSPTLRHFLTELDRQRLNLELELTPLSKEEVGAMLRAIFDLRQPVPPEFLGTIYDLTEGNPFFVEETLKSLLATGEIFYDESGWNRRPINELHIPRSIQDAVARRAEHLSPSARELLELAAVAGRYCDFALLQALTNNSEAELLPLVEELIAAQLLVEISAEQLAFRHALTRQAIYSQLLGRKRKLLHLTIGTTIEQLYTFKMEAQLADLAYHFYAGGEWAKALEYSQQLGERAESLHAPRAAIEHFTRAIEVSIHLPETNPSALYRARGHAYEQLGNFEAADRDFEQALAVAQQSQQELAQWQSLMGLGTLWSGRDYVRAGEFFRRALTLAQSLANPQLQAKSLNRMGNWLVNTGRSAEGIAALNEALGLTEKLQDKAGLAETLDLLGMANGQYGDTYNAVRSYQKAIPLWRELNESRSLSSSLLSFSALACPFFVKVVYSPLVTLEECQSLIEEGSYLVRKSEWMAGQAYAELCQAQVLAAFGKLGPALSHVQEGLRIAVEIEHQQWITKGSWTIAQIYIYMSAPDLALPYLQTGLSQALELGSAFWIKFLASSIALAYLQKGETRKAELILSQTQPIEQEPHSVPERWMRWAWGELRLAQNRPEQALEIANQLIASVIEPVKEDQPIPALLKLKGEALRLLGRPVEARQALEKAKCGVQKRGELPFLWQIHNSLGRVYQILRQNELAQAEFEQARKVIDSLAATISEVELRNHFLVTALNTLPKEKPVTSLQLARQEFDGLTRRERQVARLIGQGKSSREIADLLIVSERTIEAHVGNILAKLAFTSRTQIAIWVKEKGLVQEL